MSTQSFIQDNAQLQTQAQNNVPVNTNNGNPFTVYNVTPPSGGYLPPVANAYDEWRINPFATQGQPQLSPIGGGFPFPAGPIQLGGGGGGGALPVLPGTNTAPSTQTGTSASTYQAPTGASTGALYPVGSGGWMLGGPTPIGPSGGSLNTSYSGPGANFGMFGSGYNGMSSGPSSGGGGFNLNNLHVNPTFGNILDLLLPGDAFQNGYLNWENLALGGADQISGLPVTWLLENLANTNWANNSDSAFANWLNNWEGINDSASMQEWYDQNGIKGDATGWLSGAFDYLNNQAPETTAPENTNSGLDLNSVLNRLSQQPSAEAIYREQGAAGLINRTNPATGRTYTPLEIQNISRSGGGMGVGLRAAGAFTPGMANVLQGQAARDAFGNMRLAQLMTPQFQRHGGQN